MAIKLTGGATLVGGVQIDVPAPPTPVFDLSNDTFNFTTWGGDPGGNIGTVYAFTWGDSGNKFYVTDSTYNFREFDCATPYDFTTTSYVQGNNRPAYDYTRSPHGMLFNKAGTRLIGQADWFFYTYNLSTAWDVSSISSLARANDINAQQGGGVNTGTNYRGLDYNASEDKVYSTTYANTREVSALNVNWTTLSWTSSNSLTLPYQYQGFAFNKDGTQFVTAAKAPGLLKIYNMSTPYDVANATFNNDFNISSINPAGNGIIDIVFSDDYTKLFLLNDNTVVMLYQ